MYFLGLIPCLKTQTNEQIEENIELQPLEESVVGNNLLITLLKKGRTECEVLKVRNTFLRIPKFSKNLSFYDEFKQRVDCGLKLA